MLTDKLKPVKPWERRDVTHPVGPSGCRDLKHHRGTPHQNKTTPWKRDGVLERQRNAGADLVVVSQPPGVKLRGLKDYVYDSKARDGVTIYVVDTGINEYHEGSPPTLPLLGQSRC
jgi:hypothetical protein